MLIISYVHLVKQGLGEPCSRSGACKGKAPYKVYKNNIENKGGGGGDSFV